MAVYVPILKARPGEFQAWMHASDEVRAATAPVFDFVPPDDNAVDLGKLCADLHGAWPKNSVLTFDVSALPKIAGGQDALVGLSALLKESGIAARPVVRLEDDEATLEAATLVQSTHGQGVLVRAGTDERDPQIEVCEQQMPVIQQMLGLETQDIDLVFDMRGVDSRRTVDRVKPLAAGLLAWSGQRSWRSVAMCAGAFPESISGLPKGSQNALRRFDADLWDELRAQGVARIYGDYGVACPSFPPGSGRGPIPSLRYTNGDEWWVWREEKKKPGNESMTTLCERVVASAAFPGESFSWGDTQIAKVSRGERGVGNATNWRAWGTSHHLATVVHHLTSEADS